MKKLNINDRIFLKHAGNYNFVKVNEISVVLSAGNYCSIKTSENKSIITRNTLSYFDEALPEDIFLRINRSTIVNMDHIEKISKDTSGRYRLKLDSVKDELIISQRYAVKIRKQLSLK